MTHNRVTMVGMLLMTSFCGGALASVVLGARVEAQGPQAVTTTQVNLVDEDGVLRGVLSASDERGTASLTFYDSDGRPRGLFGVERDGPVLRLQNAAGEPRVFARVAAEDALLSVGDDQRMHAVLASAAGVPVFSLMDAERGRVQLQLAENGAPSLIFSGRDGQRRAAVTVDDGETPVMTFYEGGRPRVTIGVVQQAAVLNMTGAAESRVVIGVASNGRASVTIVNEAGEVVGELP